MRYIIVRFFECLLINALILLFLACLFYVISAPDKSLILKAQYDRAGITNEQIIEQAQKCVEAGLDREVIRNREKEIVAVRCL